MPGGTVKLWRVGREPYPVRVECPNGRYPALDAHGHMVFDNTHFDDEPSAWERLLEERRAGQSLAVVAVDEARKRLAQAERLLTEAARARSISETAYEEWLRSEAGGRR